MSFAMDRRRSFSSRVDLWEPENESYREICAVRDARCMRLDRLTLDDTHHLIRRSLGTNAVPQRLAHAIYTKADGNPLFTEQLIGVAREKLASREDSNSLTLLRNLESADLDFPDTLHGVITGRIDRLQPSPQLAIKVASVIGQHFAYDTLHDTYPVASDRNRLREFLSAGLESGLLQVDVPGPPITYQFQHAITRQVTYELLLFEQRQQLHQAIAEWYEAPARRTASGQTIR